MEENRVLLTTKQKNIIYNAFYQLFEDYNEYNFDKTDITIINRRIELLEKILKLENYRRDLLQEILDIESAEKLEEIDQTMQENRSKLNDEINIKFDEIIRNIEILKDDQKKNKNHKKNQIYNGSFISENSTGSYTVKYTVYYNEDNSLDIKRDDDKTHNISKEKLLGNDFFRDLINDIYKHLQIILHQNQNGGKKQKYKLTDKKVTISYKNKPITRNIYIKAKTKTQYCKINNEFVLLSKLKKLKKYH